MKRDESLLLSMDQAGMYKYFNQLDVAWGLTGTFLIATVPPFAYAKTPCKAVNP